MVDRTNRFGDVVGEDTKETINVGPFGQPLLLIFLQDKKDIMRQLGSMPGVFYCESNHNFWNFLSQANHLIIFVSEVGEIVNIFQEVRRRKVVQTLVAIDFTGDVRLPDPLFRLDFSDRSDRYIMAYLKGFLDIETKSLNT